MEKNLQYSKLYEENSQVLPLFRCSECKETFQKPLAATFSSRGYVQKYSACPHCLSKVTIVKHHESQEKKEKPQSLEEVKKANVAKEDNVKCKHFWGYLKKRPKDMAIPDECLTCDRMIECMLQ